MAKAKPIRTSSNFRNASSKSKELSTPTRLRIDPVRAIPLSIELTGIYSQSVGQHQLLLTLFVRNADSEELVYSLTKIGMQQDANVIIDISTILRRALTKRIVSFKFEGNVAFDMRHQHRSLEKFRATYQTKRDRL
ncbi:hypothetical protein [Pseudomonas sp.]|uniref:hypothetical protein n=1 Tax=Pseudomonas sp. TaxID=306 RepID=UPI002615C7C3|nr:hypothetical protein [Pseudomonas sp.]